jgi:hypothetical protein
VIQYESEVGAVNRMLTTRRVALASLLVIAHLVHNGKERETAGFRKVTVTVCMKL